MLNTPSGKNFFLTTGTSFFPVGARLMGPLLPHPMVLEEGGTIFLPINSSAAPGITLVFVRPDGTAFTHSAPDVYIGTVTIPETFNSRPVGLMSNSYAVYTFATNELNQGGIWQVASLSGTGVLTNHATFLVRGFVLAQPPPPSQLTTPILSAGPGGLVLSVGPGLVLQTGPTR